ncbi:asparagine synthetase B [Methanocella sp. CWC-04]|uniref:Putative asparagine synthetase [glutamine-hydrolyzing] n=1 Tax=Methanooceanicella nereidis TaxID=2052831 RepID=A0AAP2RD45_9EURY|nr:asparagine synthetase B [Methanocella sp. CWC-04]MCD1293815.1 asparagine synthetase B [Methanocella sp. CWC-04]
MCGIAGFIGKDAGRRTRGMIESIRHRGPDGTGYWEGMIGSEDVALGHAHLKITGDMSQPVTQDGKAIVYNGEIYNFGEFLPGTSDTAALSSGILKDGVGGFLKYASSINGEYAFAAVDSSGMILARDPVGIKPLYYGISQDGFGFASERKALMKAGILDIKRLTPGSVYYNGMEKTAISLPGPDPEVKDTSKAVEMLETALAKAVKLRVHPDAAIAFSGGVDCSLIGAMAQDTPLCTVGLKCSYDIKAATNAARMMDAENRHIVYEMEEKDVEGILPDVIYAIESHEPVKVSIALPIFYLAREVRRSGFRVMLSGQGADELFGGYARYEIAQEEGRLADMLGHDLRHIAEANLERDDAATMAHGVELRVPYLDLNVIGVSQKIDASLKVYFDGKGYIRKYILRKMAERYLPHEISIAPKKAIQYGTSVQKVLARLARDNGFKGDLAGYFRSLYEVVF